MGPGGARCRLPHTWDFVLARVEIDFRAELTQDDGAVIVRCTLDRIGRSSVGTREEVRKQDGTISAEARSVVVPRDPGTGALPAPDRPRTRGVWRRSERRR